MTESCIVVCQDLIMDDEGKCVGIMALCMEDGTIHRINATNTAYPSVLFHEPPPFKKGE